MKVATDVVLDTQAIMGILPHRSPMLWVDKVTSVDLEAQQIIAELGVSDVHCQGYYPDNPMLPEVYIVEALAQAGGLFVALRDNATSKNFRIALSAVTNAEFKEPVVPGDSLVLQACLIQERRGAVKFRGEALVDDVVVTTVEELLMMYEKLATGGSM